MSSSSSSPSMFEAVVRMNNEGCDSLESGDVSKALICFKEMLQEIKSALRETSTDSIHVEDSSQSGILPLPADVRYPLSMQRQFIEDEFSSPQFFLCTCPIRMISDLPFSRRKDENNRVHSAIAIFNLALVIHLQALQHKSRGGLCQARVLYDRSLELVLRTIRRNDDRATGNAIVDLLIMALYNNIGLLQLEFSCAMPAAGMVFQSLHRYAASVLLLGEGCPRYREWFCHEQIQHFLLNAAVLSISNPMSAAAA